MTQPEPPTRRSALQRRARISRVGLLIAAGIVAVVVSAVVLTTTRIARERASRDAFPMVAGQLRVEGLRARIGIDRDARGIPHVLATAPPDAWFGLGFAHAQDRLAQMLWLRRVALGRTAEVLGEAGLETDRLVRTIGFSRLAAVQAGRLEPAVADVLEAYAAGVNARVARVHSGRVARPVALSGPDAPGEIEPWTPSDSIAVGKLVAWGAGASHERPVVLLDLIERLGSMGARPFFPAGDQELGVAVPLDDPVDAPTRARSRVRAPDWSQLASLRGSAWAVPGRLTASGAPILVAELSVRPTAPSLLYEAHVQAGTLDVAGVTIPGLPVFWAGRNPDVAWAAAPLAVATVDLFKETLRRGDSPPEIRPASVSGSDASARSNVLYQNGSRWVPVDEFYEEIRVAATATEPARVEQLRVRETRHGPLINAVLADDGPREPLSLAWTGAEPGDAISGMLAVAHARNADDLRAALALHHEPPVEVVFADTAGDIGLQVAGWVPKRTLPSGLSPVPGRLRMFDWRAGVPAEELPHEEVRVHPDSPDVLRAWVVSTGTRLQVEGGGTSLEWLWRSHARAFRLRQLVADLKQSPIELRAAAEIQEDVAVNADAQLVGALLSLAGGPPELSPEANEVAGLLRSWDGVAGSESRGAVAFQLLVGHLLDEILVPTIGPQLTNRYLALPGVEGAALVQSIVLGASRAGRAGGWTDPEVVSRAVRESLRRTWMSLSYRLGHNRERWAWGRLHNLTFGPFGVPGDAPLIGPFPMAGQAESVARAVPDPRTFATRRASTYRMAVDLASRDRMLTTLAPGQSEHVGHPHFDDGVEAWRDGRPSLVVTSPFLLEEAAVDRLVLEPSQ